MSATERTGWRDQALSERHRLYGPNCPMVDLDWPVIEYDSGEVKALVECKCREPQQPNLKEANYRALASLANKAGIPFIIAFYSSVFWHYTVYPGNKLAEKSYTAGQAMTEIEFVTSLYRLRGREPEPDILLRLNHVRPAEVA